MKQTNNAIKFLMAQYRAIFKNANIAMAIAAATAALAAGQAQAAVDGTYWTGLTAGAALTEEKDIEDNGDKKANDFDLTIKQGGKLILGGNGTSAGNYILNDKKKGYLNIDGGELVIGKGKQNAATVKVTEVNVKNGTAHVGGATAGASSLTADTIVIGTKPASSETPDASAKAAAAATATFTIGQSGALASSGDLTVHKDGEIKFLQAATAADSKITAKNGISLNGGAISVDNNGNGTVESAITSTGGTINVGTNGTNATSLTVKANVTFDGEGGALNIANQGSLILSSADKDMSLNLGNAAVANKGTIQFNIADKKTGTITMTSDQYKTLFADSGKVAVSGASGTAKIALEVTDNGEIDLDYSQ
ncbi:hypothetical protein [Anaerobiospirillum succiniciproducens]|uniref:hypothetical protein n=1 Tax=Anaerobiospirillum succiniciproducens TaxID=13335 RepID=UPI00248D9AAE|nr:hypothetical protein [Anaerobiospirillum succiniciproducens]